MYSIAILVFVPPLSPEASPTLYQNVHHQSCLFDCAASEAFAGHCSLHRQGPGGEQEGRGLRLCVSCVGNSPQTSGSFAKGKSLPSDVRQVFLFSAQLQNVVQSLVQNFGS